jgi:hypothetical protein
MDPHFRKLAPDPDPHWSERLDPDPDPRLFSSSEVQNGPMEGHGRSQWRRTVYAHNGAL